MSSFPGSLPLLARTPVPGPLVLTSPHVVPLEVRAGCPVGSSPQPSGTRLGSPSDPGGTSAEGLCQRRPSFQGSERDLISSALVTPVRDWLAKAPAMVMGLGCHALLSSREGPRREEGCRGRPWVEVRGQPTSWGQQQRRWWGSRGGPTPEGLSGVLAPRASAALLTGTAVPALTGPSQPACSGCLGPSASSGACADQRSSREVRGRSHKPQGPQGQLLCGTPT